MTKQGSQYWTKFLGIFLSILPSVGLAQSQVLVHITSNDMDAAVYADSLYLGLVRGSPYWIESTAEMISLSTLRPAAWSMPPLQAPIEAKPGDSVYVTLNFPMYHRIESHPFGADAWLQQGSERRFLGVTPVVFSSADVYKGMFYIELEGYTPGIIEPKTELWNRYQVSLTALSPANQHQGMSRTVSRQRRWIDWSASAVAVVAGVVAVHYKFRADRINDEYQETGDASLRPRVARLDDYSGIALGVMQAGLVTLAVRFILD
ncbi:MAG: hypothetical protein OXE92_09455 [Bacteroidetes bacterium]|nr:hypothetical protein [Bacteroidota bacterium]MCY4205934.1 hypothetical protein [Bacteroidota bacterium]